MSKFEQFNKHRPTDSSDPGFTIPGRHLRWVNGRVSENNQGRPWVILRKSDLPKDLITHIESHNPSAFTQGDTIRRGDLVLGYASNEAVDVLRRENREKADDVHGLVNRAPSIKNKDGSNRAKVIENETTDVTQQMLDRFKASKNNN